MYDQRHPRGGRIKTGLSRYCARAAKPVPIDEQNLETVADAGLKIQLDDD